MASAAWAIGAIAAWAMGLYVLTRGGASRIPLSAAAALGALSLYMLGEAAGSPAWARATWWLAVVGSALWLGLASRLAAEEAGHVSPPGASDEAGSGLSRTAGEHGNVLSRGAGIEHGNGLPRGESDRLGQGLPDWAVGAALLLAVAAGAAATIGDAVVDWPTGGFGPWYPAFGALELLLVVASVAILDRARRAQPVATPVRTRFLGLELAGGLFGAGACAAMATRAGLAPPVAAALLLCAGTLLMGWNVARYGALVSGRVLGRDAFAYAVSIVLIVAVYGALAAVLAPAAGIEWSVLTALLLLSTHVLAGNRTIWLDRTMFGRVGGELLAIAESAARQPDELSALVEAQERIAALTESAVGSAPVDTEDTAHEAEDAADQQIVVLVGRALRHLNDRSALGVHPLADALPALVAGAATPLERGERLQRALYDAVERLRPPGAPPVPGSPETRRWREYLVVSETYAQDRQNKETMRRWGMSEGTFNRARTAAIRGVAAELAARAAEAARLAR